MALSKDLFDDSEIEAAARKISNYCNSHDCASCKFCLNVIGCLFLEYDVTAWENVLDDMKE